jgi:lipoate-protein ligase A
MNWKILPWTSASMSFHMALDEILFRQREEAYRQEEPADRNTIYQKLPPLLRFYFADKPSVTIGYSHRKGSNEAPHHSSPASGGGLRRGKVPVIQRITGGGRVEHGKDIVFSLIAHKQHDESFHSVRVSYWKIHEALKAGFETLGLKPRFYRCDEDLPEGPECFRYPISSDLALGKSKIAGGSQKRSAGTLLHQESVVVPSGVNGFQLAEAFSGGFKKIFGVEFQNEFVNPEWFEKAKALAETKYQPS